MSLSMQGYKLNRRQMAAITPVLNRLMRGDVSRDGYDQACMDAMAAAGCPLGYQITMPGPDAPIEVRAAAWLLDGYVGSSSLTIHDHMLGLGVGPAAHPADPDDLNRCLLLLELIPEWKPRIEEMARVSAIWAGLAGRWHEITVCFLEEAGLDWCKSDSAPKTFELMRAIID